MHVPFFIKRLKQIINCLTNAGVRTQINPLLLNVGFSVQYISQELLYEFEDSRKIIMAIASAKQTTPLPAAPRPQRPTRKTAPDSEQNA